jgi:hypothetical protein
MAAKVADDFVNFLDSIEAQLGPKGDKFSKGMQSSYPTARAMDLFNQAKDVQKEIGTTPRNAPMKGRAAYRDANPEQRKSAEVYAKYDTIREKLKGTFKELGRPVSDEALGQAVDQSLRKMREGPVSKSAPEQSSSMERQMTAYGNQAAAPSAAPSASPSDLPARLGAGSALFPDGIEMPADTPSASRAAPAAAAPKLRDSPTPAAAAPAAGPERDMDALFLKATGTPFEPKSRVDVARKAQLEDLLKSKPELAGKSDTQVALQWYRQTENAKRK